SAVHCGVVQAQQGYAPACDVVGHGPSGSRAPPTPILPYLTTALRYGKALCWTNTGLAPIRFSLHHMVKLFRTRTGCASPQFAQTLQNSAPAADGRRTVFGTLAPHAVVIRGDPPLASPRNRDPHCST